MLDNALEFLVLSGRDLAHAMMMLIPEAWDRDPLMRDEKKAFYQYHQSLMEPWDGPASIACTDGTRIAGVLDRNGLRPSRYWVTKDGFVVLSSECGVLPINPEDVRYKGRLQPGRMLLIDTAEGRIIPDDEIKSYYARRQPYRQLARREPDQARRPAREAGGGRRRRRARSAHAPAALRLHARGPAHPARADGRDRRSRRRARWATTRRSRRSPTARSSSSTTSSRSSRRSRILRSTRSGRRA